MLSTQRIQQLLPLYGQGDLFPSHLAPDALRDVLCQEL